MSAPASRRDALAALAGFLAVPAVPAAAAAHSDAELLRLGALLRAAWAEDRKAEANCQGRIDHEADLAWDATSLRVSGIVQTISTMQATTLDSLLVKALAASWCYPDEPFGTEILEWRTAADAKLAVGIVRDLIAMGGAA